MTLAYISHPSFVLHSMGEFHPECPARVTAISDRLIARGLMSHMQVFEAPAANVAQISRAHSAGHYERLLAASPTEGLRHIDPDTAMSPHTLDAALHAAGAAVLAADLVCTGQARRAFCNVRPPGHHATAAAAMGFCFFNNVAIGIRHAMAVHGIKRIALVDFDVHHGNGSEDIFAGDHGVLMVSTFQSSLYPFSGEVPAGQNICSVPLAPYSGGGEMRAAVTDRWMQRLDDFEPEMIWVSAGFDAHRSDELGQLRWVEADYRWISQQIRAVANRHGQGRIVSSLEGGYDLQALSSSVEEHVRVLLDVDN